MTKEEFYGELEAWFKKAMDVAQERLKEFEDKLSQYNEEEQVKLKKWIEEKVADYEKLVNEGYKHLTTDQDYWTEERLNHHIEKADSHLGNFFARIVEKLKDFFKI